MSGAGGAMRGVGEGAQAAARAERKGWLDSLKDEAVSFLKGDNNAPWAILAETVIGCVPILGQIVDARDIIKGLVEVAAAPASPLAWFNLITALIGLVPGGGDAVKRSLRAVKSKAVHVDELLDMIRRLYKGDPEKVLREALDLSKLRKTLDDILTNPNLTKHLSPEVNQSIAQIRQNLGKQFDAFKKEVDDWLAKGRKSSADTGPAAKPAVGTPSAKPNTQAKAGSQGRADHHNIASPNTPNAVTQRTARFKSLTQQVLGVMGEHMADYHCQDVKGWGSPVAHDQGARNTAKLNDNGQLVQLWPSIPRGRGLDAVWKTPSGPKPYAIVEAKASYDPTKSLAALLGEAADKTESGSGSTGSYGRKGRNAGSRTGAAGSTATVRQTNGKVTQMSHAWIEKRLPRALRSHPAELQVLRTRKGVAYNRHVLFFSIPQAAAHAEAIILHASGRPVEHASHAAHELTREWGDNQIEQVVNERADIPEAARRKR